MTMLTIQTLGIEKISILLIITGHAGTGFGPKKLKSAIKKIPPPGSQERNAFTSSATSSLQVA